MSEPADRPPAERLDEALAAAHREEQQELEEGRLRDQQLTDRVAQALSHQGDDDQTPP